MALSCRSEFVFEDHIHEGHVLWVNSEGAEQYHLQGRSALLQPGWVSIIEPGVVHANHACTPAKRHLRSLYLDRKFFSYLEKLLSGSSWGGSLLPTVVVRDGRCWQKTITLHQAIITARDQLLIDELLLSLFTSIRQANFREKLDHGSTGKASKRLNRVVDSMRAGLDEELSLEILAGISDCSAFHLIRLFREQLGMSPHAYLVQLRLERARQLLDSGQPIAEAALLAGFADQSHLTRRFKRRYGLTPGSYLRQKQS
ncbi:helix-turn-helix domain-containing protein [Desulfogranum mediterraneum]|uniref:helix-turn-helix domain-containing protein n=1 Tax=Desulfogranum mediterraneum TaxID=160661 RepID=UPI0013779793|nr:AraC family transcriptional regulator [Desulfogranum mediterraneum]